MPTIPTLAMPTCRPSVIVATFAINILGLALPLSLLQIYDRIIPHASFSSLGYLGGIIAAALICEALFRILRARLLAELAARFEHHLSGVLFRDVLRQASDKTEERTVGQDITLLKDVARVRDFRFGAIGTALLDLPFALAAAILIFFIAGPLALLPVSLAVSVLVLIMLLAERILQASERQIDGDTRRFNFLLETLLGYQTIKALSAEQAIQRRHERLQNASARAVERFSLCMGTNQAITATMSTSMTGIVVTFGAAIALVGDITIGALAATSVLAGRMMQPVARAAIALSRFGPTFAAARRLTARLDRAGNGPERDVTVSDDEVAGHVFVDRVTIHPPEMDLPLLDEVTLLAPAGAVVGIVGPPGSGKTALMKLINGEIMAQSGRVIIGGTPLTRERSHPVRTTYIGADGVLFAGTILQNVTMFRSDYGDGDYPTRYTEQARAALNLVGLEDFLMSLPRGLDTPLSNTAAESLPPGLVQKLLIARGLVCNPRIILFDEGNVGLDIRSDGIVKKIVAKNSERRTIFLVSDRPSYLALCDVIYTIENRRLICQTGPGKQASRDRAALDEARAS